MYFNTLVDTISRKQTNKQTNISDITVCIALRLNEINPWILPKLEFALRFYHPTPQFLIVDFGSEEQYAEQIKNVCDQYDYATYLYIDDKDTFSLSKARNIAGRTVETDFIFFTDVDVVFDSHFFANLAHLADKLELKTAPRRYLQMPVYHLSKESSTEFEGIDSDKEKDIFLTTMCYWGQSLQFKTLLDFVAPYSNIFLITKEFFDLSGGYCDEFRGHGSEDFEYLIRLGILSSNVPIANNLTKDFYGPLKESFFAIQDYSGFRRFVEVLTAPSESLGLRCYHVWHPNPKEQGYWTANNDWKRERFNSVLERYYPKIEHILNVDFHPRDKKALCIFNDKKSWGYFLPLRLAGYQLTAFTSKNDADIVQVLNQIENKEFDRIFIFNPYMQSHVSFRSIIEIAKKLGIEVTVIERGGLPNSIYYASEVAYGDPDYKKLDELLTAYQVANVSLTHELIDRIKTGNEVLENQNTYENTFKKNILLRHSSALKIFIPLQLPDDMAVTQFTEGYTKFADFYEEIHHVAAQNQDVLFIVKQHPLMKTTVDSHLDNLIVADVDANIHALIDICDATVVYNSGVGLLSCIHQKPTFNIGNSYYTANQYLSNQVTSIQEAINKLKDNNYHVSTKEQLTLYIDWLIHKKYSWFSATSIIREFEIRKSHAYDNIMVEILNLDGTIYHSGSRHSSFPFSTKSYLGWKAGLNFAPPSQTKSPPNKTPKQAPENSQKHPVAKEPLITRVFSSFLSPSKANKLRSDPKRFFGDSRFAIVRQIAKFY